MSVCRPHVCGARCCVGWTLSPKTRRCTKREYKLKSCVTQQENQNHPTRPSDHTDCLHCYLQCSDSCINTEHISSSSSVSHFDSIRSLWGSVVWVRTSGLLQLVCVEFQLSCSTCSSLELIWTTEPSTSCCSGLHLCVWDVCVSQSALLWNIQSESSRLVRRSAKLLSSSQKHCWGSWVM